MSRQIKCDRCGEQAPSADRTMPTGWIRLEAHGTGSIRARTVDLCGRCAAALHNFIACLPKGE